MGLLRGRARPQPRAGKPSACVLGPGFAAEDEECARVAYAVARGLSAGVPLVVDGGALGLVGGAVPADSIRARGEAGGTTVLTPHAGEAARLAKALGLQAPARSAGEDARKQFAQSLAQALCATVVLKGPVTYVADAEAVCAMAEGTPALAKAGTGDVLAGAVGALLAQGIPGFEAAFLAATIHARAGVEAARRHTVVCATPEDVLDALPAAVRTVCPEA